MGEATEPQSFSFASAIEALDDMFNALSKPKQREYLGNFNEIAVVLTGAAGLLNVVRDGDQWGTEVGKLPRPVWGQADAR